jgi:hypothetical protein
MHLNFSTTKLAKPNYFGFYRRKKVFICRLVLSVCNNGLAVLITGGSWDFDVIRMWLGLLYDELEEHNLLKPSGFFTYRQV